MRILLNSIFFEDYLFKKKTLYRIVEEKDMAVNNHFKLLKIDIEID